MTDFTNWFWPWYVGVITIVSILACALVLWLAGRIKHQPHAQKSQDGTTGHVWDEDLKELNTPLPRWWMGLFVLTIVFGLGYLVIFPGLGDFAGLAQWSSAKEHQQDGLQIQQEIAPLYAKYRAQSVEALAKDAGALTIGQSVFMNNCAQCHGADAHGSKSYPNLTNGNTAWLGERTAAHIVQTVTNGRVGMMPPMAAAVGGEAEIRELANYVLSLSGSPHDEIKAAGGKSRFVACAACHGVDGKGNKALGAPNLTDDYWLHGWGEAAIVNMVKNGKTNVMPAQAPKLTADQIHVVAAYVLSLAGTHGNAPPPTAAASAMVKTP